MNVHHVNAGEIISEKNGLCDYRYIVSDIEGDFSKFENIEIGYEPVVFCLEGSGGNLAEALKIFDFFWESNINTKVLPGKKCISSCAILFLAGGDTQGTDVTRQMARGIYPGGELWFHSPRLRGEAGFEKIAQSDMFRVPAYEGALAEANRLLVLSERSGRGVSAITKFLLSKILGTAYDKWYRLDTVGDAVISNIEILGLEHVKIKDDQSLKNICDNYFAKNLWDDLYYELRDNYKVHYEATSYNSGPILKRKVPIYLGKFKSSNGSEAGSKYFRAGSYFSGSKYGDVDCYIEIYQEFDFEASIENSYGDPEYFEHRGSRLRVALEFTHFADAERDARTTLKELQFLSVPEWYSLHPDLKISDLKQ